MNTFVSRSKHEETIVVEVTFLNRLEVNVKSHRFFFFIEYNK